MSADPLLEDVPVCVVSAVAARAPAGVACTLKKPLEIECLLEVISAHCGPA